MKITISITKSELAEEYSKKLGIPVDNIEIVVDDSIQIEPMEFDEEPRQIDSKEFLFIHLASIGMKPDELASITGLSISTISRACNGYKLEIPTFEKISVALNLDKGQRRAFRKSLRKHQASYRRKSK